MSERRAEEVRGLAPVSALRRRDTEGRGLSLRPKLLLAVLLAGGARGLCAGGVGSDKGDQAALVERLDAAAAQTTLEDSSIPPWKVKIRFEVDGAKDTPASKGTIEEMWQGPERYRVTYTSPGFNATEIQNEEGYFRTRGVPMTPYLLELVRSSIVGSLPRKGTAAKSEVRAVRRDVGELHLDCVSVTPPGSKRPTSDPFRSPTFCFAGTPSRLLVTYRFGMQTVVFENSTTFQQRRIPMHVEALLAGVHAISATVESLESVPPNEVQLHATSDLAKTLPVIGSDVPIDRSPVLQPWPEIPDATRMHGREGEVLIEVLVDKAGRVREQQLIYSSDEELTRVLMEGVRHFVYHPYLANGQAAEFKEMIPIHLNIRGTVASVFE